MQPSTAKGPASVAGIQYRRDIDGLRAVAVGLVLLHHVGVKPLSGGYIGVDVFFVISGYLITSIIFPKIANGSFSFMDFFARRIKRLGPVLSLVIGASLVAGTLILLPSDLEKLGASAIAVSVFAGNFFFWRNYGGYFADDAQSAALLHTWSLAVEEQYYLLWPLSLIVIVRIFGLRNTVLLLCLALPPLIYLSEIGTQMTIGAAYYLLPTRFFELLAGSVAALIALPDRIKNPLLASLTGAAGLACIIYASLHLRPFSAFPGYNALWPVIGTLLLLASWAGVFNRLLALGPMVYLGKLSYSLYLWHWPLIAFVNYTGMKVGIREQLMIIAGSLLLSIASYHLLENPLRLKRYKSKRQIFLRLYLVPTLLIGALSLTLVISKGLPGRFGDDMVKADQAIHTAVNKQRLDCHAPARDWARPMAPNCRFGSEEAKSPTVLVVGDSHANHLVPFISVLAEEAGISGNDYTMDRCPPLIGLDYGVNSRIAGQCAARNKQVGELIAKGAYKYVVLSASWPDRGTGSVHESGRRLSDDAEVATKLSASLRSAIKYISDHGATPIIIRETPELYGTSPRCELQRQLFGLDLECNATLARNRWLESVLPKVQDEFPALKMIELDRILCSDDTHCDISLKEVPLYRDDNHLNAVGSSTIGDVYKATYPSIFTN